MNLRLLSEDGSASGDVELLDDIFAAKVNGPLMHQAVTAQLSAARAGTHSTKTRGEVRGGGAKPWRQKGTGRARHGSIREPQWAGGGIAFGPKPRDHSASLNKKMRALALRSALSDRAADGKVLVVSDLEFPEPKTKRAIAALEAWEVTKPVLLVLTADDMVVAYSFRNIPGVHLIAESQLNTFDVLKADTVVFARSALDAFQQRAATLPGRKAATTEDAIERPAGETEAVPAETPETTAGVTGTASPTPEQEPPADAASPESGEEVSS